MLMNERNVNVTDGRETPRRVGVAIVGLGGAVATTAAAGVEMIRLGLTAGEGLPLRDLGAQDGLVEYQDLHFAGWDLCGDDLARAAEVHEVLPAHQLAPVAAALAKTTPWPAIGDNRFHPNIDGVHRRLASGHRAAIEALRADLAAFRRDGGVDSVVMINLASTERAPDPGEPAFATLAAFEHALDGNDALIGPAMLHAYAALREGVPYANFTPSVSAEVPALIELAEAEGVPIAGKDGKTGQTMLKTLLAPGFRARGLRVEGWFSTNILGNRDGLALDDPESCETKLKTKAAVLEGILGYPVDDHVVNISYYRPRGDSKEAWDNIDLVGFLGQRMQLKVNFLCRDSILAAPLVIEIARLLDLASQRGDSGVQSQLGVFFKAPMTPVLGDVPVHALMRQETELRDWLLAAQPAALA